MNIGPYVITAYSEYGQGLKLWNWVPWKESYDKPRQCIKKQRHHFADKGSYSQSCGFSSSHVQMWDLDHKEGWQQKNQYFKIVVLEKTLESPLDSKEIKPINPKASQLWILLEDWCWSLNTLATWRECWEGGYTRRRRQQRMRWLDSITDSVDMNLNKLQERVEERWAWCAAVPRVAKSWTQLRRL